MKRNIFFSLLLVVVVLLEHNGVDSIPYAYCNSPRRTFDVTFPISSRLYVTKVFTIVGYTKMIQAAGDPVGISRAVQYSTDQFEKIYDTTLHLTSNMTVSECQQANYTCAVGDKIYTHIINLCAIEDPPPAPLEPAPATRTCNLSITNARVSVPPNAPSGFVVLTLSEVWYQPLTPQLPLIPTATTTNNTWNFTLAEPMGPDCFTRTTGCMTDDGTKIRHLLFIDIEVCPAPPTTTHKTTTTPNPTFPPRPTGFSDQIRFFPCDDIKWTVDVTIPYNSSIGTEVMVRVCVCVCCNI